MTIPPVLETMQRGVWASLSLNMSSMTYAHVSEKKKTTLAADA